MSDAANGAHEPALQAHGIGKVFRVPAARGGGAHDPRRENLSRRKDNFWALREVSFSVPRGKTLGIVGHNGSGKSTLVKILAGVMTADHGGFTARGRIGALLELGAGFHPDLTGIDNVYLNGALLGLSVAQVDRLLPEIISFAELERFMDMPVRHFSSGMQARLGFAVATRLAPEILLMDETFATGDARFQAKALAHVAGMRAAGHTLVLVSHSLELIQELADEVLWLDHGRVRALGAPRAVLDEYRRSQHALLMGGAGRGGAGLDGMFEPVVVEEGLTISDVSVSGTEPGERIVFMVALEHGPEAQPREAIIETAWQRTADGLVLAQSLIKCAIAPGEAHSTLSFAIEGPPMRAAQWRVAVGVRWSSPCTNPQGTIRYADRRVLGHEVATHLPVTDGIMSVAALEVRWGHTAGA